MKRNLWITVVVAVLAGLGGYYWPRATPSTAMRAPSVIPPPLSAGSALDGPYFSDVDDVGQRIVAAIHATEHTLDAAMYDLTQPEIAAALEAARRRGVNVRVVVDEGQVREAYSQVPYLRSRGLAIRLSGGYRGERSLMHDKFAVFDGRLAVTGSFNWTASAERYNFENALFVSDPAAVKRFEAEFQRIWDQAH
jgi:phosphatidylserine/phosphatidylglycerophosphate/cardiolipin synthase-like enzyme